MVRAFAAKAVDSLESIPERFGRRERKRCVPFARNDLARVVMVTHRHMLPDLHIGTFARHCHPQHWQWLAIADGRCIRTATGPRNSAQTHPHQLGWP